LDQLGVSSSVVGGRYDVPVTRFPARWDRNLRVSTAFFVLVLGAVALVTARALAEASAPGPLAVLVAALMLAFIPACWALAPRAFVLQGRELLVERPLAPPIRIPLAVVRTVSELPDGALRGAWKVMGVSGAFGHYGRFRTRALGMFRLYATRRDGLVAVQTGNDLLVLSPERPGAFIDALLAVAPAARRAAPADLGKIPGAGRGHLWVLAAVIAAIPLAVGVAAWVAWSRGPRSITVRDDAIEVERNMADPVTFPLADVREVEPLSPARLAGLRRTAGTSGFGVLYGRFWSPSLGPFQLYGLTDRRAYVLLERPGGRLVVTPDEPERFVAEVRAAIAQRP